MKFLLILLLALFQDPAPGGAPSNARAGAKAPAPVERLMEDLDNNDPTIRESATGQLITREHDIDKYKALFNDTANPEVKWRIKKVIDSIEANQKFRSMTTIVPLITIKYEGSTTDLFAKLSTMTGQKFDARAFGDNKVKIDCTDEPVFKILDLISKQIGYEWVVTYRDAKENVLDQFIGSPILNYISTVELTALGMSDRTPHYTGQGFKMQAVQTSLGINNKFGTVTTEAAIQFKYASDPGLKFAVGPKIKYTKIITDAGIETINRSLLACDMLFSVPPTTKSVNLKGKATYRIPMKIETVVLEGIETLKPDANHDVIKDFAQYPDISVAMSTSNALSVLFKGTDNLCKERFTGTFKITKLGGAVVLENGSGNGSGYISVYEDHFQFYIYGTPGSDDAISKIEFQYISELRDIEFDFAIDNIPLY